MEMNENENTAVQNLWDAAKAISPKREVHSNTSCSQKIISISNTQANLTT